MSRIRFSIAGLMAIVSIVAVGIAALRNASVLWASVTFTLAVVMMLAAVVGVAARRGRGRVVWFGFAVFGWAYLAAAFGPWPWLNNQGLRPPPLLSTELLNYFLSQGYVTVHPAGAAPGSWTITPQFQAFVVNAPADVSFASGGVRFAFDLTPTDQIGHSLAAILSAGLGALIGSILYDARGERRDA